MEFPGRETTYISHCSSGHLLQTTDDNKLPEIELHIVGADETLFRELAETMKKRRRRSNASGREFEYLLEFKDYSPEPI